jgi:hypothetical protein
MYMDPDTWPDIYGHRDTPRHIHTLADIHILGQTYTE